MEESALKITIAAINANRIIREKALKQSAIAVRMGMNAKTFNAMLKGRKCIYDHHILKLAEVLGCEPNDLFKDVEDN